MKYISINSIAIKTLMVAVLIFSFANLKAQKLSTGWGNVFYICPDSTISAMGYNSENKLGDATHKDRYLPVKVKGLHNVIAVNGTGRLALLSDGTVWQWGKYWYSDSLKRINIDNVAAISAGTNGGGSYFYCALKNDGSLWLWGDTKYANGMGYPDSLSKMNLPKVKKVAGGGICAIALCEDGSVWTWGDASVAGNGIPFSDYPDYKIPEPQKVQSLSNIVDIAAGDWAVWALKEDGTVWEWGGVDYINSNLPRQMNLSNVKSIFARDFAMGALKTDGTLIVKPDYYHYLSSDTINNIKDITSVALTLGGDNCSVFTLDKDENLWRCGGNYYGQLGNFTTYPIESPELMPHKCMAVDCDTITNNPDLLIIDTLVYPNEPIKLKASLSESNLYWWYPKSNVISGKYNKEATVKISENTEFNVVIMDTYGCMRKERFMLRRKCPRNRQILDTLITPGSYLKLKASDAHRYNWTPTEGLSCNTCQTPTARIYANTEYVANLTDNYNCQWEERFKITNNCDKSTLLNPPVLIDTVTYPNARLNLTAPKNKEYSWLPSTGIGCSTCMNTTATVTAPIRYEVNMVDSFYCASKALFNIKIRDCDTIVKFKDRLVTDALITPGSTNTLSASNAMTYSWTPSEGLSCNDCQNPKARIYANTEFTATMMDKLRCQWTERFKLTNKCDDATLANPKVVMDTVTYPQAKLNFTQPNGREYIWQPTTGLSCGSCKNPTATITNPIEYSVSMVDSFYCASKAKYNIRIRDCDTIVRQKNVVVLDTTIHYKTTIPFLASESYNGYVWNPTKGLSCISCQDPTLSAFETANYTVTTYDKWRCPLNESFKITMVNLDIFIPNVFTPNGDGVNDYFEVKNIKPNSTLKVLNSNEALVFSASNYDGSWDGTESNGNKLPEGTYWYILDIPDAGKYTGWVYIKR